MFLRIGHRGAKGYEPENTLKSFEKAIKLGVNAIEFDVRETKDKELVVFHDSSVKCLTQGRGFVKNLTLKEIKSLKVEGEPIPVFTETLDFIDKKVEKILIELKVSDLESRVLKEVKKRGLEDRVIIVSFLAGALKKIQKLDKSIETGLIYVVHPNPFKSASLLEVNYLLPLYRFCHTSTIQKAKKLGLKVLVWTINKKAEALKYAKKGVDGITSDKPDILNGISGYDN